MRATVLVLFACLVAASPASAQRVSKYGADFLAGGVGARALAMGGAQVGLSSDVHSVYWNPAGLQGMERAGLSYMHAERFAGIVSFDYGSAAMALSDRSTVGVAYFRSGVNDIKNTLDAWDPVRGEPRPDPSSHITTFSAADHAFFVSYARRLRPGLDAGVTAKIIRRTIGSFAGAWGYSFDLGLRYGTGSWQFGVTAQDVTTMLQSWSVDAGRLAAIRDVFGDELPSGGTEVVLPVVRLGSGYAMAIDPGRLTLAADVDLVFDGTSAQAIDLGRGAVALYPRFGAEYAWRDIVAVRAGISRLLSTDTDGLDLSPTVGTGLKIGRFAIDYSFGDFAGLVSALGYSHRISASFELDRPRPEPEPEP